MAYTISNKVNFVEVPDFQPEDANTSFPTIYGNYDFSFTVSIEVAPPDVGGEGASWQLISASCTSSPDFVDVVSTGVDLNIATFNVSRDMNVEVFPGERFETVRYGYNAEGDDMNTANSSAFPSFPNNPNDIEFDANTEPAANSTFTGNTSYDDFVLNLLDPNISIFPTEDTEYGIFESFSEPEALNANEDSSVYAYIVPPVRVRNDSYTFQTVWQETGSLQTEIQTTTYQQEFQWHWAPALDKLEQLKPRSRF